MLDSTASAVEPAAEEALETEDATDEELAITHDSMYCIYSS